MCVGVSASVCGCESASVCVGSVGWCVCVNIIIS